jgi:hypothetical protein
MGDCGIDFGIFPTVSPVKVSCYLTYRYHTRTMMWCGVEDCNMVHDDWGFPFQPLAALLQACSSLAAVPMYLLDLEPNPENAFLRQTVHSCMRLV